MFIITDTIQVRSITNEIKPSTPTQNRSDSVSGMAVWFPLWTLMQAWFMWHLEQWLGTSALRINCTPLIFMSIECIFYTCYLFAFLQQSKIHCFQLWQVQIHNLRNYLRIKCVWECVWECVCLFALGAPLISQVNLDVFLRYVFNLWYKVISYLANFAPLN